jgi:signal transduction histidine kinase
MKPPSALTAVGGFGVAVALMSVATTAAIVVLVPEPPARRVTPWAAMNALVYGGQGFIRYRSAEPRGHRLPWVEQLLAIELRRNADEVRVVWIAPASRVGERVGGMPPQAMTDRVFSATELARLGWRDRRNLLKAEQPALVASIRTDEGDWLSVRPDPPWLNAWRFKVLAALGGSLALLAALALLLARHLTRPFRDLAEALGHRSAILPTGGPRELRDAVAVIAETRSRLEEEVSERSRMLSAIAHDLRTPLTALRLRVETAGGAKRERMIADIERMQAMIRDILEFTQAAAMPRERLAVRGLLKEAVAEMPGGEGRLRLLPGREAWVEVPPLGLRRAVENLMRNALDYADDGDIELLVGDGMVSITVRDDGPGIRGEDMERMLRAFERGEVSRNRETGGVGLGLSIVQEFAAREGGRFELAANTGGGTLATLTLPSA